MLATMTALQKKDGGVRGIATGSSFRRLVAKTLARQFGKAVEATCSPFRFALSTRAGTDCVGHAVRTATDRDPQATVLSIDGIGACDHVHKSAMLGKLLEVPSLRGLLPFVRAAYLEPSRYKWADAEGVRHDICQAEGGEQGDPLMPLLFSLAIHNALAEVKRELLPGELPRFAFWTDVLRWCVPGVKIFDGAGIRLHAGKTRVVEQGRNLSSQHGRSGPQGVERRGDQDFGHPSQFRCVCAGCFRGQIGRGTPFVGGHSMGAGRSMWLANPLAVRWTPLSPLLEDSPSFTIRSVRPRP